MPIIDNWHIASVHGGGICLFGKVDNIDRQTTNIIKAKHGAVMTASGSVYDLGEKQPGLWSMQLQLKRPDEFEMLRSFNII